jgi:hypothetical protein
VVVGVRRPPPPLDKVAAAANPLSEVTSYLGMRLESLSFNATVAGFGGFMALSQVAECAFEFECALLTETTE